MKKTIISIIGIVLLSVSISAQEFSLKYGKITNDELNMTVYDKDTTASAVVLYDDGYTSYDYKSSIGFFLELEVRTKIKILKQDGVDEANISIPYHFKTNSKCQKVSGIEAYSYNMEKGKIVKSKLDKKYIFDEEINSSTRQVKFSIPNVKVGSVIEYKYKIGSDYYIYNVPDWYMQREIPVKSSFYEVILPEYFSFNIETRGYENIKAVEESKNQQITIIDGNNQNYQIPYTSRDLKFSGIDLPALKDDKNVWCVRDFMSRISFELKGTKFPNDFYKPYSNTWEDLEKTIKDELDFGSNIKMSNPYKEEVKELVKSATDEKQKIELIYKFVKEHIRWNEEYSFNGNKAKEAVKNGIGDNGQINMVLLSALKDAGIKAFPVLISRRSEGRLPLTYPSLNKLTTFIIGAETSDSSRYYMDGSAIHGGLNMLPTDLLVDRARVFESSINEKWVDLTKTAKNYQISTIKAKILTDGKIKGSVTNTLGNQFAYSYKSKLSSSKDSVAFIDYLKSLYQINIDSISIEGKESMSNIIQENISFTKDLDTSSEYIYINPMIFSHLRNNEFTQSERKLPIEFNFPYLFQLTTNITIPENYQLEEVPKPVKYVLDNNRGKCVYYTNQIGNTIQLNYMFDLRQTIFPQTEYEVLQNFFGQIATKNSEMLVLKKI